MINLISEQFITRLVLLGHMIQISPNAVGEMGKRILNNISKYIVDKQQTNDDEDNIQIIFSWKLYIITR